MVTAIFEPSIPVSRMSRFPDSNTDVHTVASLLKLYLRELPEPVIPFLKYEEFLACTKLLGKDDEAVMALTSHQSSTFHTLRPEAGLSLPGHPFSLFLNDIAFVVLYVHYLYRIYVTPEGIRKYLPLLHTRMFCFIATCVCECEPVSFTAVSLNRGLELRSQVVITGD